LDDAEMNLTKLKENTKLSFDKSVKLVVDSVLNKGDTI
jgi:hypothetical protein